jgi:hypothetical protein
MVLAYSMMGHLHIFSFHVLARKGMLEASGCRFRVLSQLLLVSHKASLNN